MEDRFDLALRVGPLEDAELVCRRLWDVEAGMFAAKDFVARELRGRTTLPRKMLERSPAIVTRPSARRQFVGADGRVGEVVPSARFTVNDPRAAVEVARHGVGLVVVPVPAVSGRELVRLRTELGEPEPARIHVVYPSRRLLPARVRLVLTWLAASEPHGMLDE